MRSQVVTKNDLTEALADFRTSLNKDFSKLATKMDLSNFATKEDLEKFATKNDLNLLEGHLKDYIQGGVDGVIEAIDDMSTEHLKSYHTPQAPLAH